MDSYHKPESANLLLPHSGDGDTKRIVFYLSHVNQHVMPQNQISEHTRTGNDGYLAIATRCGEYPVISLE